MADIVANAGVGTARPTGAVQFGDRLFLTYEDARPMVLQTSHVDNLIKAYNCGIKAPTTAPGTEDSADAASNLTAGDTLYIAYCFYSKRRVTYSRFSPTRTHTVASGTALKVWVRGFEAPRDDAASQDIDTIIVAVQVGTNLGLMTVSPTMWIDASDMDFTTLALEFDLSATQLANGANMSEADPYFDLPPAVKFIEKFGDRLWLAGQRRKVEMTSTGLTVAAAQTFRGETVAKLTLNGTGTWDDSHLKMGVRANGRFLGEVWDVYDERVAYLDRDVDASIGETTDFYLTGHNDRLWPTSFTNFAGGLVETVFPECTHPGHFQLIGKVLDEGATLRGLQAARDRLHVVLNDNVIVMTGGGEVNEPLPEFATEYGRTGATSERSIGKDSEGAVAYWGEEGPIRATTAGVNSIGHELGVNQLSKGGRWIALGDLDEILMTWSRAHEGYVLGNFTIDGVANFWGLLTFKPQYGLWLFDGQAMTSNLLEYPDENGQGVLLVGDAYNGRVKRLLSPDTLQDLPAASDTAAAYSVAWRSGWVSKANGSVWMPTILRILGAIIPGTTATITATIWVSDFPYRDEDDLDATKIFTRTVTKAELAQLMDVGINPASGRYVSVEIGWESTSGASGTRAMEIPRVLMLAQEDLR